jgi:hypothetical protein
LQFAVLSPGVGRNVVVVVEEEEYEVNSWVVCMEPGYISHRLKIKINYSLTKKK